MVRLIIASTGALLFATSANAVESEELAAPNFPMAPPLVATLAPLPRFQCQIGLPVTWAEEQKTWCCKHEEVGCPSTSTTADASTTTKATTTIEEAKLWSWSDEEAEQAETTTTREAVHETVIHTTSTRATTSTSKPTPAPTTTTLPPTTTTEGPTTTTTHTCDEQCTVNGVAATCRDQIQQASLSDFLGSVESCSMAQQNIADQCSICAGCPPHAVGCGILEAPTTTAPTTTIPEGEPCNAVCTLGEQPATCNARMRWTLDHVFADKPHACQQAHEMVLGQCSVCSLCTIEDSECGQAAAPVGNDERLFDCDQGATMEWSEAKQVWCCEHHQKACDLIAKKQVFFQRKVSDKGAPAVGLRRSVVPLLAVVGLAALATAVATFLRGPQRRRQHRSLHAGLVDHEVFSE